MHLVFIWNRKHRNGKLFINGEKFGDVTSSYQGSDIDLKLTNHTVYEIGLKKDTGEVLHGSLRDLAVFLRALTPGDVFILYSKFLLCILLLSQLTQELSNVVTVGEPLG